MKKPLHNSITRAQSLNTYLEMMFSTPLKAVYSCLCTVYTCIDPFANMQEFEETSAPVGHVFSGNTAAVVHVCMSSTRVINKSFETVLHQFSKQFLIMLNWCLKTCIEDQVLYTGVLTRIKTYNNFETRLQAGNTCLNSVEKFSYSS